MEDTAAIMVGMFLTGTLVAVVCIAVPIRQVIFARRKRQCILNGYSDYLIAADRQDLAALERDLRDIVSILLGEYTDEELEAGIGRCSLLLSGNSGVIIEPDGPCGQWKPPDKDLPDEVRLKVVAEHLVSSNDARLILPLSEALSFSARERQVARIGLLWLLPQVTATHKSLLMSSSIYYVLASPTQWKINDLQLVCAFLETIGRIGHVKAASFVRIVVERDHGYDDIRELAQKCMAALAAEKDRQRHSNRLLRPSSEVDEHLLHPVIHQPDFATDNLVRPADPVHPQ